MAVGTGERETGVRIGIDASNIRAGGGVTHLVELLRAANPTDQGVQHVVVWSGQATLRQLPDRPWLQLRHDPMLDRPLPWRQAWQFGQLPRLAERSCDVLFTPGATSLSTQVPVVTMCQNMLPFEPTERQRFGLSTMGVKLVLLEFSQRRSFKQANGIIFLTRYAQDVVQGRTRSLPSRLAIIPHGIAQEFRLAPRSAHPLGFYSAERPLRVVYVSIVTVYKHQWHVAEAIARLRRAGLPVALDIVGPAYGPALVRLQRTLQDIDPGQEFIRYIGSVNYTQLPTWYHDADAFVYASSCENLPIILLEAMAAGLPIACSNRGPMPEVLGHAGVYFDPESTAEITTALETLLMHRELRQQYAHMAFEQSLAYTWERCAKETFEFIVQVANHSTSVSLADVREN